MAKEIKDEPRLNLPLAFKYVCATVTISCLVYLLGPYAYLVVQ